MNGNDRLRDKVAKAIADAIGHGMAEKCYTHADAAIAALLTQEGAAAPEGEGIRAAGIPDGWKLVPIEPTWDMRNEGREFLIDGIEKEPEKLAYFLWKTMIAATPEQPR